MSSSPITLKAELAATSAPDAPDNLDTLRNEKKTPKRRPTRTRWIVLGGQILVLLAMLGTWYVVTSNELLEPVLAKTPGETWTFFVEIWRSGELWSNTRATMLAVLIAWGLAGSVGVVAGVALGLMPTLERIINPYFDALNAMPRIALAPLFIVVFGISTQAKVALASTLVFFIVCSSARAGVKATDGEWLRLSHAMNASKFQVFSKILLPVAVPSIFSGLRLGLIYSLLGVVGTELISARNGLGQLVAVYSAQFHMEGVYALLIFLAIIATVLNQLMNVAERYFLRWQPPAEY